MTTRTWMEAKGPWHKLASLGVMNAIAGIARMTNLEIQISRLDACEVALTEAQGLLGEPEAIVVGVYLSYDGASRGHILLAFPEKTAFEMIDLVLGQAPGTTLDMGEMEASVMGEMGNIAGSFFLNELSDSVGAPIYPSPPAPIRDMASAIVDVIVSQTMETCDMLHILDMVFRANSQERRGQLLVIPVEGVLTAPQGQNR